MLLKEGVSLVGLQPIMRPVLREAERIWKQMGKDDGVTVTEGPGGLHSADSWHYYGYALDLRTRYFTLSEAIEVYEELKEALPDYDIIHHTKTGVDETVVTSHIHAEIGNALAARLGVLF